MKKLWLTAALLAAVPFAARADLTFTTGNHPQPDEANILFESSETGVTLDHGEVDHSGAFVTFDSLTTQLLTQQAQGQADIFCALNCTNNGGNQSSQLNSIEMTAGLDANGIATAWGDVILNLDFGTGNALVTATDNFDHTFTYALGNGQNFLTIVAVPGSGEVITDVKVQAADAGAFGFNSFKQPRVSGLCELQSATSCAPIPTVPEPASLAILGVGLAGLLWTRRRMLLG